MADCKEVEVRPDKVEVVASACFPLLGAVNWQSLGSSCTMACLPVSGDNPQALASGLSYVQVDKHGITIL